MSVAMVFVVIPSVVEDPVAKPEGASRDPSTPLRFAQDDKESAHFNQRHHDVLQGPAFALKFLRCSRRFDVVRAIDQHAYFGKRPRHNEPIPTSQPPTARIFQIYRQDRCTGFLCEKNDAWPEFVCRAARAVRSDYDIAAGRQHLRQLENCTRAEPRTGAANHIVAEALNGVGQQIAVAAGADQCSAMPLRKKTAQDQWEDQQSIVPKRADIIFRDRSANDTRAVVDFITQRTSPELQQAKSKRDQPSREPTFDFQLLLGVPRLRGPPPVPAA